MTRNLIPFFAIIILIFTQSYSMQRSRYLLQCLKRDTVYFQKQHILELRQDKQTLLQENKNLHQENRQLKQQLLQKNTLKKQMLAQPKIDSSILSQLG